MRAVEAGEGEVLVVHAGVVPGDRRPAVVVRLVLRLGERVGALQHEPVAERAVERDLQRLVAALRAGGPVVDAVRAGRGVVLAAGLAGAGVGVVHVEVGVAAVRARADVGDLERDVPRQALLERQVPLLDRGAVHVGRVRRPHENARRQRDVARADVRHLDRRDALAEGADPLVRVRRVRVGDVERVGAAHRPRPRQRVERAAVAGADDAVVGEAVHQAEARREVPLLELDAHVLGHAALAADEDGVGVVVEPLQAAVGALHERVVLEAGAERQRQLLRDVPAVADEEGRLPLAARHLLGLDVLRDVVGQPDQERREAVPLERLVAVGRRLVAGEAERAARALAELRLPVVELVADDVDAAADLVLREHLRERGREGVAALLAEERHPAVRLADLVAVVEERHAALADVAPVRAGDAPVVEADVRPVVRPRDGLVLLVDPEAAVEDDGRAEGPGVADRADVDLRVAEPAAVVAEHEEVADLRPHHRELGPDVVRRAPLPGELHVVVVPAERGLALDDVVVGEAVRVEVLGGVRHRVRVQDLERDRAEEGRRDAVAGERQPARAVGAARERVVELEVGVGRGDLREVARAHLRGRDGVDVLVAAGVVVPLEGAEEEELVLLDRAAEGAAVDVARERGALQAEGVVVVAVRVQLVLVSEEVRRAVELVRAGLGDDRDGHAGGHALVGVEVVRRDVDGLDRLRRVHVADVVRQPDVHGHGAVDAERVVVPLRAVHVRGERAAGRVDLGVLRLRRRRAGHEVDERLVVAELVERQVHELLRLELGVDVGLLGLQERRLADDVHRLGEGPDLQLELDADGVAGGDRHARLAQLAEALHVDRQVVGAGRQVAEGVAALGARDGVDLEVRAGVRRGHGRAGDGRAGAVHHRADDRPVEGLGRREGSEEDDGGRRQRCDAQGDARGLCHVPFFSLWLFVAGCRPLTRQAPVRPGSARSGFPFLACNRRALCLSINQP